MASFQLGERVFFFTRATPDSQIFSETVVYEKETAVAVALDYGTGNFYH
jgi:hypothetical protein